MGTGLRGVESITREMSSILKAADVIFLERYTSIFPMNTDTELQKISNRGIISLDREEVESLRFLENDFGIACMLVSGDPMSSTTHFAIVERCNELGIQFRIFENASILTAIPGRTGLSPYKIAAPVSIPIIGDRFVPKSVVRKIVQNFLAGNHTPLLIDLRDGMNMDPVDVKATIMELGKDLLDQQFLRIPIFILSRVGWSDESVEVIDFEQLDTIPNRSPYCIVLPSKVNENELQSLNSLKISGREKILEFSYEGAFKNLENKLEYHLSETKKY